MKKRTVSVNQISKAHLHSGVVLVLWLETSIKQLFGNRVTKLAPIQPFKSRLAPSLFVQLTDELLHNRIAARVKLEVSCIFAARILVHHHLHLLI